MNKEGFIKELASKTGLNEELCNKINEILESTFLIGKNNKDKILNDICSKLNIPQEKADEIYNAAMGILGNGILDKLKHPFKSQD
ncbi:MAG: hypothetical protein IJ743_04910 [Bacilli bacterium]|nr:hypothetical protein [Bacilli bacterium]MBR1749113.1 hypothetical protein [Bacilli bacterium]MBR1818467.1 hypothetical protein [Bacilli bacterium]